MLLVNVYYGTLGATYPGSTTYCKNHMIVGRTVNEGQYNRNFSMTSELLTRHTLTCYFPINKET